MPSKNISIRQALKQATDCLRIANLDSASLDAELLLAFVLKKDRVFVLTHGEKTLTALQYRRYHLLITRRAKRYPLAYLTGHKEFYGLDFKVNEHTLVPRPESELMVDEALAHIDSKTTVIDIGTGSGCLIISVLKHSKARGYGLDISAQALTIAKANARRHKVNKRITCKKSNLLSALKIQPDSKLLILANLPYLKPSEMKEPSISREPKTALLGGEDGLTLYRKLGRQLKPFSNYTLLCEINPGQKVAFKKIFPQASFKNDLSGRTRLAIIAN